MIIWLRRLKPFNTVLMVAGLFSFAVIVPIIARLEDFTVTSPPIFVLGLASIVSIIVGAILGLLR